VGYRARTAGDDLRFQIGGIGIGGLEEVIDISRRLCAYLRSLPAQADAALSLRTLPIEEQPCFSPLARFGRGRRGRRGQFAAMAAAAPHLRSSACFAVVSIGALGTCSQSEFILSAILGRRCVAISFTSAPPHEARSAAGPLANASLRRGTLRCLCRAGARFWLRRRSASDLAVDVDTMQTSGAWEARLPERQQPIENQKPISWRTHGPPEPLDITSRRRRPGRY
jgi:hypothetical protein